MKLTIVLDFIKKIVRETVPNDQTLVQILESQDGDCHSQSTIGEILEIVRELLVSELNDRTENSMIIKLALHMQKDPMAFQSVCQQYPMVDKEVTLAITNNLNCPILQTDMMTVSSLVRALESSPNHVFLRRQNFFHLYLGLFAIQLQTLSSDYKKNKNNQILPELVGRLNIIEANFKGKKNSFVLMQRIFEISSILIFYVDWFLSSSQLTEDTDLQSPNASMILGLLNEQQAPAINKWEFRELPIQITFSQFTETIKAYCNVMKKYTLIDPEFRIRLLQLIQNFSAKNLNQQIIRYHLEVVNSLLRDNKFPEYQQEILSHLITMYGNHTKQQITPSDVFIITQYMKILFENICNNDFDYLLSQKHHIIRLADFHSDVKIQVFHVLYQLAKKDSTNKPDYQIDDKVINFLVEWNVNLNAISPEDFVDFIDQRGLAIDESTCEIISQTDSLLASLLLEKKLTMSTKSLNVVDMIKMNGFVKKHLLNTNTQIYIWYCSALAKAAIGNSGKEHIDWAMIKSVTVRVHLYNIQSNYTKLLTDIETLFEYAIKNQIASLVFWKNMLLLCSLYEDGKQFTPRSRAVSYAYAAIALKFSKNETHMLISHLLEVYKVTASQTSFLLILYLLIALASPSSRVESSNSEQMSSFTSAVLGIVAQTVEKYLYHRIVSCSKKILKALILLSQFWSSNQQISGHMSKLYILFSNSFTKAEIDLIIFQYDQRQFEDILRDFHLQQLPILKLSRSSIITSTLDLLIEMLRTPDRNNLVVFSSNNQISLSPSLNTQSSHLQLKFEFLLNRQIDFEDTLIEIASTPKEQCHNNFSVIKHWIVFKQGKLLIKNCQTKKFLFCSDELLSNKTTLFRMQISNGRFILNLNEELDISFPNWGLVQRIKFRLGGNLLVQNLLWKRSDEQKIVDPKSGYQIHPGQMLIKVRKCCPKQLVCLRRKVSLTYAIAILYSYYQNNAKDLDFNDYYNRSFQMLARMKKSDEFRDEVNYVSEQKLIDFLFEKLRGKRINTVSLKCPQISSFLQQEKKSSIFFSCFISAIFTHEFLFHLQAVQKLKVLKYLQDQLLGNKYFQQNCENESLKLFYQVLLLSQYYMKIKEQFSLQISAKLAEILYTIILIHKQNDILLEKIKIFSEMAEIQQSSSFRDLYCTLMNQLLKSVMAERTIARFIITNLKQFALVFRILSIEAKTLVMEYLIENQPIKLNQMLKGISDDSLLPIQDWVICSLKLCCMKFFNQGLQSPSDYEKIAMLMGKMMRLKIINNQSGNSHMQESRSCGDVIGQIIKKFAQTVSSKYIKDSSVLHRLLQFCTEEIYISFLISLVQNVIRTDDSQFRREEQKLIECCFQFIFDNKKEHTLKSLILFRRKASSRLEVCQYLFKLKSIYYLSVCALSAFLQYTLEVIFLARHSFQAETALFSLVGESIRNFLSAVCFGYPGIPNMKISKPLLYCFPKMKNPLKLKKETRISFDLTIARNISLQHLDQIGSVTQNPFVELEGGIYFKILCAIANMIEMFPHWDLSDFLNLICKDLSGHSATSKQNQLFRVGADFTQLSYKFKQRQQIQVQINELRGEHSVYYMESDHSAFFRPLEPKDNQNQSNNHLTPFFIDYFVMRMCRFLENMSQVQSAKCSQIARKYSTIIIPFTKNCRLIMDEMNEKNVNYQINYQSVDEFITALKGPKELQIFRRQAEYHSPTKSRESQRKSQSDKSQSGKKSRTINLDELLEDHSKWGSLAKQKQLHRYFRNQSKIVYLVQLLHAYYTVLCLDDKAKQQLPENLEQSSQLSRQSDSNLKKVQLFLSSIEIPKIYRFTTDSVAVLTSTSIAFPNLTSPFTRQQEIRNYGSNMNKNWKYLSLIKARETADPSFLCQSFFPNAEVMQSQINQPQHEKPIQDLRQCQNYRYCEVSRREGVYFCEYSIQREAILCVSKQKKNYPADSPVMARIMKYGIPKDVILAIDAKKIYIPIQSVHRILFRKFNQVKNNSLQFFFNDGRSSLILIMYTELRMRSFLKLLKQKYAQIGNIKIIEDGKRQLREMGYTQSWVNGQMSNFEYLMHLNELSGRSFSDLNQYYVFPWVLQNYQDEHLNLNEQKNYRDLTKPIGALNPLRLQKYYKKMQMSYQQCDQCLYGSHYSTSMFILYYLVRLEPFTTLHCDLQSGNFDEPDRLFSSMQQMWECLTAQSSTSDIKEAIPQFYYLPTFLKNVNGLNLGTKQNGNKVNDVELPPWAKDPVHFIQTMRAALQSNYVSQNLHAWINLVFGKDQCSKQKHNVYMPSTYVENVDVQRIPSEQLEGYMAQICYYGQNPSRIFDAGHPKKKIKVLHELNSPGLHRKSSKIQQQRCITVERHVLERSIYIGYMEKTANTLSVHIYANYRSNSLQAPLICEIDLGMLEKNPLSLIRMFQTDFKNMRKMDSKTKFEAEKRQSVAINIHVDFSEITLSLSYFRSSHSRKCIIKKIKLSYPFKQVLFNETVFIVNGYQGLRIYDWRETLIDEIIIGDSQAISQCYMQCTHFFFLTCSGCLYVYDFSTRSKQEITQISDRGKCMKMSAMYIFPEPKQISKRNQFSYKILLVGNQRHIAIISYIHRVGQHRQLEF